MKQVGQVVGSSLVEEVTLAATLLSEVDLPLLTNNLLESFVFLLQSLTAEKENGAVLDLHLVGIPRLGLYNCRLLALVSPVSDNDLFSYGKACHKTLPGAGYLLLISHSGPSKPGTCQLLIRPCSLSWTKMTFRLVGGGVIGQAPSPATGPGRVLGVFRTT